MTENSLRRIIPILLTVVAVLTLLSATAAAEGEPGSGIAMDENQVSIDSVNSLQPTVTETGKISLSLDGLGTNAASGTIDVEKPAGATVKKAYMAAASTGFSNYIIPDGGITIDGVGVTWDASKTIPSSINCYNHWSDVTSLVKPKIDSSAPGRVSFSVADVIPSYIDGVVLAVIFDDPSQTTDNTIILLYGAQAVDGDTFAITLAEPVDKTNPNLKLDFSLGISYGYQTESDWSQYSRIDINNNRLTTSAGGWDDGESDNGALLTVGGLDDTNTNPPDPYAQGSSLSPRYDDELYNLLPFVNNGDTSITVYTQNPSNNDNIFFAALNMKSAVAIVGEGIVLSPLSATNPVGSQHTVTATVKDDSGQAVVGRLVTFNVVSGPHAGATGTGTTDTNGEATFTYTGTSAGTDAITASFVDSQEETITSNEVSKNWVPVESEGSIDIEKYVWNGTAWVDADTAPGPSISCAHAKFNIVVTNTGDVPLTGINVTDDKYGKVSLKTTTLAAGASTEAEYDMALVSGQQVNTAEVEGYCGSTKYTDSDDAHYYGPVSQGAQYDNRLRESSSCVVYSTATYLDVGKSVSRSRDVLWFDLSKFNKTDIVSKATLSLFWYYPEGATRPSDTVVDIYRPIKWDPKYVTWYYVSQNKKWPIVGGTWFDKNGVSQGSTPYGSVTFPAGKVPDNKYYEFDVTKLVQQYINGTYENTGFFLKARTESGNYIAFYSSDYSNAAMRPKLNVCLNGASTPTTPVAPTGSASAEGVADNRLRQNKPAVVYSTTTYIDIGKSQNSTSRDVMLFNLSDYKSTDTISKATLSLYWYYAESGRTSDTVVDIYRPAVKWDPKYVSWNNFVSGKLWTTAGGDWFDKNNDPQGSVPYATVTFPAGNAPDNKYYEFDVTELVQAYIRGDYENTGFFLKARTEGGNYIAFYSLNYPDTAMRPKLTITR